MANRFNNYMLGRSSQFVEKPFVINKDMLFKALESQQMQKNITDDLANVPIDSAPFDQPIANEFKADIAHKRDELANIYINEGVTAGARASRNLQREISQMVLPGGRIARLAENKKKYNAQRQAILESDLDSEKQQQLLEQFDQSVTPSYQMDNDGNINTDMFNEVQPMSIPKNINYVEPAFKIASQVIPEKYGKTVPLEYDENGDIVLYKTQDGSVIEASEIESVLQDSLTALPNAQAYNSVFGTEDMNKAIKSAAKAYSHNHVAEDLKQLRSRPTGKATKAKTNTTSKPVTSKVNPEVTFRPTVEVVGANVSSTQQGSNKLVVPSALVTPKGEILDLDNGDAIYKNVTEKVKNGKDILNNIKENSVFNENLTDELLISYEQFVENVPDTDGFLTPEEGGPLLKVSQFLNDPDNAELKKQMFEKFKETEDNMFDSDGDAMREFNRKVKNMDYDIKEYNYNLMEKERFDSELEKRIEKKYGISSNIFSKEGNIDLTQFADFEAITLFEGFPSAWTSMSTAEKKEYKDISKTLKSYNNLLKQKEQFSNKIYKNEVDKKLDEQLINESITDVKSKLEKGVSKELQSYLTNDILPEIKEKVEGEFKKEVANNLYQEKMAKVNYKVISTLDSVSTGAVTGFQGLGKTNSKLTSLQRSEHNLHVKVAPTKDGAGKEATYNQPPAMESMNIIYIGENAEADGTVDVGFDTQLIKGEKLPRKKIKNFDGIVPLGITRGEDGLMYGMGKLVTYDESGKATYHGDVLYNDYNETNGQSSFNETYEKEFANADPIEFAQQLDMYLEYEEMDKKDSNKPTVFESDNMIGNGYVMKIQEKNGTYNLQLSHKDGTRIQNKRGLKSTIDIADVLQPFLQANLNVAFSPNVDWNDMIYYNHDEPFGNNGIFSGQSERRALSTTMNKEMMKLDELLGTPYMVTSMLRSLDNNESLDGAATNSPHLIGEGIDIVGTEELKNKFSELTGVSFEKDTPTSANIPNTNLKVYYHENAENDSYHFDIKLQ